MNILENKRVIGVSAAFLVAFGALTAVGVKRVSDRRAHEKELKGYVTQMATFNQRDLKPSDSTLEGVANALTLVQNEYLRAPKKAGGKETGLLIEFENYKKYCQSTKKDEKGSAHDFISGELEPARANLRDKVIEGPKRCKLGNEAANLGIGDVGNIPPVCIPLQRFQMLAAARIAEIIADSANYPGAEAIGNPDERPVCLEKINCLPIPGPEEYKEILEADTCYIPLRIEVVFSAKRSMVTDGATPELQSPFVRVMNGIVEDKDFFIIPTGVSVESQGKPAAMDEHKGAAAAAQAAPDAPGRVIVVQKSGSPDDMVTVRMAFDVLYFTGVPIDPDHDDGSPATDDDSKAEK